MAEGRWAACMVVALLGPGGTLGHAETGSRVKVSRPGEGAAVKAALQGAVTSLGRPECSRILTDFVDARGRPLQQNLETLGLSGPEYLGFVLFRDADPRYCERGNRLALTTPGSRVVFVCPDLPETQRRDPVLAEAMIIHEALHTLGLEENPPSSQEITRRVLGRCGR